MKRHITILVMTAITLVLAAGSAFAQGRIIPRPRPGEMPPPRPTITIASQHTTVHIDGQVAVTTIEQTFANHLARIQEGTYVFPIPRGASVAKFTMWMGGEEVEGEIVEAGKARRIYEDIVRRSRDPGLLEYIGQGLFQARVFPIPASGTMKIRLAYEQVLDYNAGLVEYRLPMRGNTRCACRADEVSISVEIEADAPIRTLYSPTHDIDRAVRGRSATCGWEERNVALTQDFLLYFTVSPEDVTLSLITHRPDGHERGYFMLLASPGASESADVVAKTVVFIVDKSGSMKGDKIEQAKASLAYCIRSLGRNDRFNIIAFSTAVESFTDTPVSATRENRRRAQRFIDDIEARGGTDIASALDAGLDLDRSGRPQMLVFLTDGLPTVGEKRIERILAAVARRNGASVRVFSFGVGHDVNTTLLDKLADDNRGTVAYIKPDEDIEVKVTSFFDKVSYPVLSEVAIDIDGISTRDVYPRTMPDLFKGSQIVMLGRYDGDGPSAIELSGRVGDRDREFTYEGSFARRTRDHAFIARLWASRKIAYLLAEIKTSGHSQELVDEIIALSLDHGIVTPYTSYLILEEGTVAQREQLESVAGDDFSRLTVESEDAIGRVMAKRKAEVRGGKGGAFDMPASGPAETMVSSELAEEKNASVLRDNDGGRVQYAGGKRFVLTGEEWVDAEFEPTMDIEEIEFASEAYFALLTAEPEVGEYLALGEHVTFVHDNKAYRITSS